MRFLDLFLTWILNWTLQQKNLQYAQDIIIFVIILMLLFVWMLKTC